MQHKKKRTGIRVGSRHRYKVWNLFRSRIEYLLLRAGIFVMRPLPVTIIRNWAMWLFSAVHFRQELAEVNLRMVFPEMDKSERERILKEMYRNLGLTAVESYIMKPERVFKEMEFEGWEKVEKVLEAGKGVIIASGHLGNFEMAGRAMAHRAPLCVIVKRQHNPFFDRYANKLRLKENCEPIQPGNALRPILKKFKQNGLVVVMTDQNARYQGYQLEFMGHKASTHISAAKIAISTCTPIVIAGVSRNAKGYPQLKFTDTIAAVNYENSLEGQLALMQRILDCFGKMVQAEPEHWFWVHRRWRKPELAKPLTVEE